MNDNNRVLHFLVALEGPKGKTGNVHFLQIFLSLPQAELIKLVKDMMVKP